MNTRVVYINDCDFDIVENEVLNCYPFEMKHDGSEITDSEALEIIKPVMEDLQYKLLSYGFARYQNLKFVTYDYREELRQAQEREFSRNLNHQRY